MSVRSTVSALVLMSAVAAAIAAIASAVLFTGAEAKVAVAARKEKCFRVASRGQNGDAEQTSDFTDDRFGHIYFGPPPDRRKGDCSPR
jgi:uncharacterized membrane protein